jgi:hypothetical protein
MKLLSYGLTTCIVGALLLFTGCQKEAGPGNAAEQEEFAVATAESDAEAETVFDDVFNNVMGVNEEVAIGGTGVFGKANRTNQGGDLIGQALQLDSNQCFNVTITHLDTTKPFPVSIVIDFGAGCTGRDGNIRKGKIIAVYTNRLLIPGASATTTFDGYYVNDIKVEGTQTIINNSSQDTRVYSVIVAGAKLTKPNGNFSQWNSEKTISQIEGLGTPYYPVDDVFKITGGANGSVKRGDKLFQWNTIITEPLIKKFTCRWIAKGTITIRKTNTDVAVLDYGNGDCDNKATYTVNGNTIEITLR